MSGRARGALEGSFFARTADQVAPDLIGLRLLRRVDGEILVGEIVEVEAYLGARDRASHTFGGRRTERNEAMYGPGGTAYVYFTYGMHFCMNIVCGEGRTFGARGGGVGEAVLIRALRPLHGLDQMRTNRRRGGRRTLRDRDLCSGPAKLTQALGINRSLNGHDLLADSDLSLVAGVEGKSQVGRIGRAPRIGVDSAGAWASRRLRWLLRDSEFVSVGV